jgi:flagellar biosynthesis/type III secretory pathway chaperone
VPAVPQPTTHLAELIDELREILEAERRALLSGTPMAINDITQRKMLVADLIDQATLVPGTARPDPRLLQPLARYNQENAVICAAMLRHLTAAIDRLRHQDPHRSYGPDGSEQTRSAQHALGAA